MIAGSTAAGDAGNFVAVVEGAGYPVIGGIGSFGGASLADFVNCHPSPLLCALLHSCKLGSVVPMSISLCSAWALPWHGGLLQFWVVLLF